MRLEHPDALHRRRDEPIARPIDMHAQWLNWESRRPDGLTYPSVLFTVVDLGGPEVFERWVGLARSHRRALNRVMLTRYRSGRFVDDRLFDRAVGLESFDRVRHGGDNRKFRRRIERCQELAGDVFTQLVGDPDAWAKELEERRTSVAHDLLPSDDGGRMHWVAEAAYYLFVMCMLREIGARETLFDRIRDHSDVAHLRERLSQTA